MKILLGSLFYLVFASMSVVGFHINNPYLLLAGNLLLILMIISDFS